MAARRAGGVRRRALCAGCRPCLSDARGRFRRRAGAAPGLRSRLPAQVTMDRRAFLQFPVAAAVSVMMPRAFAQAGEATRKLLILVELKGGNDGLNTVIPYADPEYARLRSRLAIARDQLVVLDERNALHPSLEKLLPTWRDRHLAIVRGVGYPQPNLSHFRSIEIWDTGSRSDEYLEQGWLARAFRRSPGPP